MSGWLVYLITILDALVGLSLAFSILSGIICLFCFMHAAEHCKRPILGISFAIPTIIFAIFAAIIPTTKDAMLIYALPKITNNKQVQEIPSKILQSVNDTIYSYDQYIQHKLHDEEKSK